VSVILVRLLTPHEFGLAGMVLVLSSIVPTFSGLAFGSALVQRRTITDEEVSTVFWASLAVGAAFSAIGVLAAGAIAKFYGEPAVGPLAAVLAVSFFVSAIGMTQSQLLHRELRYRSLELRTMAATLAGAVAGVAAAFAGWGAWALILQQLVFTCVASTLVWLVSDWRPSRRFSFASLRELGSFGGQVSGSVFFTQLTQNVDNVLIGRYLGAAALGTYSLAYSVMLAPFTRLTSPLQEILYAAFSRIQDEPERLVTIWLRVNRIMGAIALPLLLGLVAVAPDLIPSVFGHRWQSAVPVVQILAWVGVLETLQGLNASVLLARGRSRTYFRVTGLLFAGSVTAFVIGLHWGIVGIAVCYAVSSTLLQPIYTTLAVRAVGATVLQFVRSLAGVALASFLMLGVAITTRLALLHTDMPTVARLGITIAVSAVVYVVGCALLAREVFADLDDLRRGGKLAAVEPLAASA
jgi:O-antigen/teichoic acid export membrane protein